MRESFWKIFVGITMMFLLTTPVWGQLGTAASADDGPALTAVDGISHGDVVNLLNNDPSSLDHLRTLGLIVFTTPFNTADGLGDGPFIPGEGNPTEFGHRPTLQGNGLHLRLNGLDAQSCNECHSLISHATTPPELGIGGAGTVAQSAFPAATLLDIADTFDDRIQYVPGHDPDLPLDRDGVADFNGRFINAPFLFGGGGVEALAKEMTADLQRFLKEALDAPAGTVISLDTHGVNFGSITNLGHGLVELDLDGIGSGEPDGGPYSRVSAQDIQALREQLVVRPFGRKGEAFTMRDFDRGAMQFHFGMQPVEVPTIGSLDEDRDGLANEMTIAEMTVLHIFDVTNPVPTMAELDRDGQIGFELFQDLGCADCHRPELRTKERVVTLSHPEIAESPFANVYAKLDLQQIGFAPDPNGNGVIVPLFSDLKRHDMGPGLAETCEPCEVPNEEFITARLWGIADTGPYLHDGRATSLYQAIVMHGGDADPARIAFQGLGVSDQKRVIHFLRHLRTPVNPNEDILP